MMIAPPQRVPTGIADQAITPAMLETRPIRWLGTIDIRRLCVLMFRKSPKPEAAAQKLMSELEADRKNMPARPVTAEISRYKNGVKQNE